MRESVTEGPARPLRRLERALPWALALATVLVFANGACGPFLFDDARFAMDDPPMFWMRPVLWWTVLFNRSLSRVDTLGYHLFNVSVHVLAGLVLFGLVRRTLALLPAWREPTERSLFSFAVALAWLVHPLQTESVTYLSGRSESLAGLLYLTTVYAFARSGTSSRPRGWLALALSAFVIGMGVKELVATAPVIVLLYDRTFPSSSFAEALRRRPRFYAGLFLADLALAAVTIGPQLLRENSTAGFGVATFGAWEYLRTQSGVLLHYLALSFWPADLCLDYQWTAASTARQYVPQSLLVLALLGATLWGLNRRSPLAFLGAWFFVVLAPTSSFVPHQDAACERRMYLPLAAVVALALAGAWGLARAVVRRPDAARRLAVAASLVASAALGLGTIRRNELYRVPVAMWQDVVERAPHGWRGHLALGIVLMEAGRFDESAEALERSIALSPRPNAYLQLGVVQEERRRLDLALAAYDRADALRPDHGETLLRRGMARLEQGSVDLAHADLERSAALEPTTLALIHLGIADLERGAWNEAGAHFRAALALDPASARARGGLGRALFQEQLHAAALPELAAALREAPEDQDLHTLVGACLSALGRPEEALEHYRRALEILPDAVEEHLNLGRGLADLARHDEAARELRRAVSLAPRMPQSHELLARTLLAKAERTAEEDSEALSSALEAATLTQHSKPRMLETLAAAYAATGDRGRARETLERAVALVPPGDAALLQRLAARLDEYRAETPR
jgi:tetratricopeptide (TPR) repeat protein